MKSFILNVFLVFQLFLTANASSGMVNIDFFKKFNDDYLVKYICKAIENNHELKEANAKVEQYRYEVKKELAGEFPELSVNANYLGVHFPGNDENIFIKKNSFILPFSVNWEADLLLRNKDKIKSKDFIYKAKEAYQKGVYLSLLTDVASSYINILLYDYLIEKQKNILKNEELNLDYEAKKVNFGVSDCLALNNKKEKLKNEKNYFDNLVKNQKAILYNFSTLIGESPVNYEEIERGEIDKIEYQENIPEIINSDLIYERPDMVEAENMLKSANVDISVARKDFFPSFNIMALMFFDTAGKGSFFDWDSSFAFLLAGLTQDIFNGGRKIANLKIKKAKFKELFEKYKQIDLIALKEISNALNLIKQDTNIETLSKEKVELQNKNLNLAKNKLKFGTISNADYIDYEINLNQKEQSLANAKTARLVDYITLYKALGGGL